MHKKQWKRAWSAALAGLLSASALPAQTLLAQDNASMVSVPSGLQGDLQLDMVPVQFVQAAHFAIPFEVDRTGRLPSEVNLWVSADRGRSWLKYATNSPDKRAFEFHAAAEGEYLFAVQTRDERGASALAASPPMRIEVDTTRPQVDLSADLNASGRLVITYKIAETHLDEDAVKLEYATDGQSRWQEIRPGSLRREGEWWTSSIEVEMPRCRELELKISVSDKARNTTEAVARYNAPRTASANTGMQLASQRAAAKPQALGQGQATATQKSQPTHVAQPTPAAHPTHVAQRSTTSKPTADSQDHIAPMDGSVAWEPSVSRTTPRETNHESPRSWTGSGNESQATAAPANVVAPKQPIGQTVSDEQPGLQLNDDEPSGTLVMPTRQSEELPAPTAEEDRPAGRPVRTPASDSTSSPELTLSDDGSSSFDQSDSPALKSIIEKLGSDSVSADSGAVGASPSATPPQYMPPAYSPPRSSNSVGSQRLPSDSSHDQRLQSNAPPRNEMPSSESARSDSTSSSSTSSKDAYHSRSRSFSLDYSVESLRGIPISDIELWGTTDRGNTWERWGSDPDRESPFDVQVGDDGLFGFRMVIIGQNGMVSNRPQDGDTADMWINVDTSLPSVKVTRALYGEGDEAGMLVIDYSASDDNLHDRPITLSFSERPSGPWTTIASGLRNTGIYLWKADPKLPEQVYLRIQAVDRAGNQQEHRLELPINLRGLTPRGRIQGFRPIDTTK